MSANRIREFFSKAPPPPPPPPEDDPDVLVFGPMVILANRQCSCGCPVRAVAMVLGSATLVMGGRTEIDELIAALQVARDRTW